MSNAVAFGCGAVVGGVLGLVAGIVLVMRDVDKRLRLIGGIGEVPPEAAGWEATNVRPVGKLPKDKH